MADVWDIAEQGLSQAPASNDPWDVAAQGLNQPSTVPSGDPWDIAVQGLATSGERYSPSFNQGPITRELAAGLEPDLPLPEGRQEEPPFLERPPEEETLSDRIHKFLFTPEGAQTTREAIQGAVESIPHMAVDTAKMGYKGLRMAMGGPEERARIMMEDVIPSALQQGQQTAEDIQSPFGTPEFLRGAGQIGMMAAPGMEFLRELRTPEVPLERPQAQPEVPPEPVPVTPEVPPASVTPDWFQAKGTAAPPVEAPPVQIPPPPIGTPLKPVPLIGPNGSTPAADVATAARTEPLAPVTPPAAPTEAPSVPEPYTQEAAAARAAEQPAGVPQKPSKIGQSIEAKAVEAKLTEGFSETAGYDPITIKDQAERASSFVQSSPTDARAVIRGDASLPEGLRGTSLITAMEEHLLRHPDAQVAYELANSPLTSATSAAAQEMRLMAERVPDSIAAKFQEIREARKAGSKLRGETPERMAKDINKEVIKQASKRPTWEAFVREITC